jgi:hypothetical protein
LSQVELKDERINIRKQGKWMRLERFVEDMSIKMKG